MANWGQAEAIEKMLLDAGVTFKKEDHIKVDDIVLGKDAAIQIRPGGNDDAVATLYSRQMSGSGSENYPPVVLWKNSHGLEAIDAIHRTIARRKAGIKFCHGYVVETDNPLAVAILRRRLNTLNAATDNSINFRLLQAIELHKEGLSIKEAANQEGIEPGTLGRAIRIREVKEELLKQNPKFAKLKVQLLERLAAIHSDKIRSEAASLASQFNLRVFEINDLCKRIQDAANDDQRMAIIKEERNRLKALGADIKIDDKPIRRQKWQDFCQGLRTVKTRARTNEKAIMGEVQNKAVCGKVLSEIKETIAVLDQFSQRLRSKSKVKL